MKITHVETYPVRVPLKPVRQMRSSLGQHRVSEFLLVRIGTDRGIEGVGEATTTPNWSGETCWTAQAIIRHVLAPLLLGQDPRQVESLAARMDRVCVGNPFAKAALEMALWDIVGQAEQKPVYQLLGGPAREKTFRCRFSLGAYEPDRAAEVAAERVAAGFDTIKIKVGADSLDLQRVRAVREAVGPQVTLTVDANGGWELEQALVQLPALLDLGVALVEQPTPRGDDYALRAVQQAIPVPVMADEGCFTLTDARRLLRGECCRLLCVYPGKNAGLLSACAIATAAQEHQVPCSVGSNLELDVATAAMAHLVVAHPNLQVEQYPGDVLGPEYHEFPVVENPVRIEGPSVTVPEGPGLGVQVDWARVQQAAIEP